MVLAVSAGVLEGPVEKRKYIKIILALLQSISTAVVCECAVTLMSLSQAPTAIRRGTGPRPDHAVLAKSHAILCD